MTFQSISELYTKHGRWVPLAAFFFGFLLDIFTLTRIDDPIVIIQQAIYLLIAAALIAVEVIEEDRPVVAPARLAKVWKYREALLHFLFGSLLNSYAIFYFKSSSALTSFLFIAFLGVLLTLIEFKNFGKSQTQVHVAFLCLCLISFFIPMAPMIMGYIGTVPFLFSVVLSVCGFAFYFTFMKSHLPGKGKLLRTRLLYPYAVIQTVFVILYFINAIPPVPLSVKYMGIFHGVKKVENGWELTKAPNPTWKFWEIQKQVFLARPGDEIFCYAQIFSPVRFKDQLQVRWLYWNEKKQDWLSSDAIPMPVLGGREQGFRTVTKKSNFWPGKWRVQVETLDNREIGRIGFEVVADESVEERVLLSTVR